MSNGLDGKGPDEAVTCYLKSEGRGGGAHAMLFVLILSLQAHARILHLFYAGKRIRLLSRFRWRGTVVEGTSTTFRPEGEKGGDCAMRAHTPIHRKRMPTPAQHRNTHL